MKKTLLGLAGAAALAVISVVCGKARIRKGNFTGDMYIRKKSSNPKMVFVTNQTPGKIIKNTLFNGKK